MIWIGCIALLLLGFLIFACGCVAVMDDIDQLVTLIALWAAGILLVWAAIHYMPFDVVMT